MPGRDWKSLEIPVRYARPDLARRRRIVAVCRCRAHHGLAGAGTFRSAAGRRFATLEHAKDDDHRAFEHHAFTRPDTIPLGSGPGRARRRRLERRTSRGASAVRRPRRGRAPVGRRRQRVRRLRARSGAGDPRPLGPRGRRGGAGAGVARAGLLGPARAGGRGRRGDLPARPLCRAHPLQQRRLRGRARGAPPRAGLHGPGQDPQVRGPLSRLARPGALQRPPPARSRFPGRAASRDPARTGSRSRRGTTSRRSAARSSATRARSPRSSSSRSSATPAASHPWPATSRASAGCATSTAPS
jgi:hypothetical protein